MMKIKIKNKGMVVLRILPLAVLIGFIFFYNKEHDLFTAESIFEFTPSNLWLAAGFFLLMYALKPITLIIPLWILQISCAMFFPRATALLINTLGISLSIIMAYVVGYYLGQNKVQQMYKKIKKNKLTEGLKEEGHFFYVFVVRVIGIISMDITGMIFGSMKINFPKYFMASLLGLMPAVVIGTFIGTSLSEPNSLEFMLSLFMKIILVILSILFYRKKYKKTPNEGIILTEKE